jgi:hypothetical protein
LVWARLNKKNPREIHYVYMMYLLLPFQGIKSTVKLVYTE